MNHIEAMKRALESCEAFLLSAGFESSDVYAEVRAAIKQAEKQEPVACKHNRYSVDVHEQTGACYDCGAQGRMRFVVYETAPPQREWVGLTDEEIFDVIRSLCADNETAEMLIDISMDEYRAIEAKLKEKNT